MHDKQILDIFFSHIDQSGATGSTSPVKDLYLKAVSLGHSSLEYFSFLLFFFFFGKAETFARLVDRPLVWLPD